MEFDTIVAAAARALLTSPGGVAPPISRNSGLGENPARSASTNASALQRPPEKRTIAEPSEPRGSPPMPLL
ncbi:MAG: hypothetical protein ACP5NG_01610 [Conexivisphaera sp.]